MNTSPSSVGNGADAGTDLSTNRGSGLQEQQVTGASPSGDRAFVPSASSPQAVSPVPASIPSADDLATKTPWQIANLISALSQFISAYTPIVAQQEEAARRQRELLASAMAEMTRLTHFVVRGAASAIEAAAAGETRQGLDPQDESAVGYAETPNPDHSHAQ